MPRTRLTDRIAKTISITERLDIIASELEQVDPRIALAIDQVSDRLEKRAETNSLEKAKKDFSKGLSKFKKWIDEAKKETHYPNKDFIQLYDTLEKILNDPTKADWLKAKKEIIKNEKYMDNRPSYTKDWEDLFDSFMDLLSFFNDSFGH